MTKQLLDEQPEIRIDRNGVWYYQNVEMKRNEMVQYFYRHLCRDDQGHYRIELNQENCSIQVEDVPYVIRTVSSGFSAADGKPVIVISLSDGSCEELNPETIRIGDKDVLYCRVKKNEHEARFSRQAYYQLAENIKFDPHQDRYFISIGNHSYTLAVDQATENGGPYAG